MQEAGGDSAGRARARCRRSPRAGGARRRCRCHVMRSADAGGEAVVARGREHPLDRGVAADDEAAPASAVRAGRPGRASPSASSASAAARRGAGRVHWPRSGWCAAPAHRIDQRVAPRIEPAQHQQHRGEVLAQRLAGAHASRPRCDGASRRRGRWREGGELARAISSSARDPFGVAGRVGSTFEPAAAVSGLNADRSCSRSPTRCRRV